MGIVPSFVRDTLFNLITNMGTQADKNAANQYGLTTLNRVQLENAYRGDWIARKVVDIPPFDMTREWRSWQADKKDIGLLEEVEKTQGLQMKVARVKARARLYGGAAIVMGIGDGADPREPVDFEKIKKGDLKYLHVVSPHEITPGAISRNVLSSLYGEPEHYDVRPIQGTPVRVHPTRVCRFIGMDLPDVNMAVASVNQGWGDSVLQAVDDAIKNAGTVSAGVATMVHEANFDVIKIPGMMENIGTTEYENKLMDRINLTNRAKSIVNAVLVDSSEEWTRMVANFSSLPDVLKMYLMIASGAADIPATRLLGQSPSGLNATGDGDLRNYYDRCSAEQKTIMANEMRRLDEVVILSALGAKPEGLHYRWNPLWQLDSVQSATVAKSKADVYKIDVDAGLVDLDVLKKGRENQLIEDGTYPGIEQDIEDLKNGELDENNPEVRAQFEKTGAAPAASGAEVQKQALNGTQITSLQEIVTAVVEEQMPAESAKAILAISFPTLAAGEIDGIIDPLASFEAKKKPPPPAFGAQPPPAPANEDMPKKPIMKVVGADGQPIELTDSTPRTLYVRRDVLNGDEIMEWARKWYDDDKLLPKEELHVTLIYSETPVDWMAMGEDWMGTSDEKGRVTVPPGGPRIMEMFGPPPGDTVVLTFSSTMLQWRHMSMVEKGASHRYPEYQPHISIAKTDPVDLIDVEPYRGKIVLGPEIFEEIK